MKNILFNVVVFILILFAGMQLCACSSDNNENDSVNYIDNRTIERIFGTEPNEQSNQSSQNSESVKPKGYRNIETLRGNQLKMATSQQKFKESINLG